MLYAITFTLPCAKDDYTKENRVWLQANKWRVTTQTITHVHTRLCLGHLYSCNKFNLAENPGFFKKLSSITHIYISYVENQVNLSECLCTNDHDVEKVLHFKT